MPRSYRFESMPNFRRLVPARTADDLCEDRISKQCRPLKLFRSSRPDLLTAEEAEKFEQLNMRSVVDLRSASEYRRADGPKLLDAVYPVYKVLLIEVCGKPKLGSDSDIKNRRKSEPSK